MQRSRLHSGNIGREFRTVDMGMASVLGKVSGADKLLRDSWNGNRGEPIDHRSETLRPGGGGVVGRGRELKRHDCISITVQIPLQSTGDLCAEQRGFVSPTDQFDLSEEGEHGCNY